MDDYRLSEVLRRLDNIVDALNRMTIALQLLTTPQYYGVLPPQGEEITEGLNKKCTCLTPIEQVAFCPLHSVKR